MRNRMLWMLLAALCLSGAVYGQNSDPGFPDTVYISSVSVNAGEQAVLEVNFKSDEDLAAITLPLHWSSDDISLDSVSVVGSRVEYLSTTPYIIYPEENTVVFGAVVVMEADIAPGYGLLAKFYFDIPPGTPDQFIYVDSITRDIAFLMFTNPNSTSFIPEFFPGVITAGDPKLPPHINLSPTSMVFEGTVGFPSPAPQGLNISNGGEGELSWTAESDEAWLTVAPENGIAPSNISVLVDALELSEGQYSGNIIISCEEADNSPQYFPVTLNMIKLPPTIVADPQQITVSAVQGGDNPADRFLYISTSVLGSELNWTVANSESWLTLSPLSGSPPDSVTLSFDITGMTFGEYYDEIVIIDPEATNSPLVVPVSLQIVSDLPVIKIEPERLSVVIETGLDAESASFYIFNSGEGSMDFEISETSEKIISVNPVSGIAPTDVELTFDTELLEAGIYYDTIMITSTTAINSPFEYIIKYTVMANPPELYVIPSGLNFTYYECWQGVNPRPDYKHFQIENHGGGSLFWEAANKAEWLDVLYESGTEPIINTAKLNADGLPVGVYYDTIVITADNATHSPRKIAVTLSIVAGTETPEMTIRISSDSVYAQEVFGDVYVEKFSNCWEINMNTNTRCVARIENLYPGCMDYSIEENIPWLKFVETTGQAPNWIEAIVEIGDYKYGIYDDHFFIHSESASNSPIRVDLTLQVWRLHGDVDWNNRIDLGDAVKMVNHVFKFGPPPIPEYIVGDCNCDNRYNIGDIVVVINYIFSIGDKPCGNL
ncbi:MAG: BACON domain-containing carbohydrate-binding protein [candidate division Zixibacteria bacterium]